MTRRWVWTAIAAIGPWAPAAVAGAQGPACFAEVETVPANPVVGQQVLYRVRMFRREDVSRVRWVHPPAFASLRAEWLPGRAEDTRRSRHGSRYLVREEHRALFAAWPGRFALPAFELRCAGSTATVPGAILDVREPPSRGRPADFDGIIGPIQVQALAERRSIPLGESVHVSVLVRGASNLWDLDSPYGELEQNGAYSIFAQRPQLDLETGAQLYLRRYFRYDFVPHQVGTIEIPAIEIPYYDPGRRRFGRARSDRVVVAVGPRPIASTSEAADTGTRSAQPADASGGPFPVALALGTLVVAGGAAGFWLGRRRRELRAEIARALDDARGAEERRDPAARAAALLRALDLALASTRRQPGDEIARLRDRLEGIRFGAAGASGSSEVWDDAHALISELR